MALWSEDRRHPRKTRREDDWDAEYERMFCPETADPAFVQAIDCLQWGWRNNRRIGQAGRYNRKAFQQLMQVVLKLPPLSESPRA
jgi:hypothetical protein